MSQVDEGLIHAWIDGQLPPEESARVERLVATDPAWGAATAEARGLVAGASRILGALDDVPSVRPVGAASGGLVRAKRALWREPWLQAAAVILLAVGVGPLVVRNWNSQEGIVPSKEGIATSEPIDRTRMTAAPVIAAPPAVTPASPNKVADAGAAKSAAVREKASAEAVNKADALADKRLERVAVGSVVGGSAPSGAGAGASAAVASVQSAAKDTAAMNAVALQKPVVSGLPIEPGRAGFASGGRGGGRAAPPVATTLDAVMRDEAAKSVATSIIDPRLAGCWIATDSALVSAYVLKFVDPVATDVLRAARPLVEQGTVGQPVMPRALPAAPAGARVQNTTPRIFNSDSTFTAEWVSGNARTNLVFTVRGDTLTGATRVTAGDIISIGVPFRAARVQCPK